MGVDSTFPQIDDGALKAEATAYNTTATDISGFGKNVKPNVVDPLYTGTTPWTGGAATTCSTLIDDLGNDNTALQHALHAASRAITTYLKAVTQHRGDYNRAAGLYTSIENEGLSARMTRQKQSAALKAQNRAAAQAVADVKAAAQVYAKALDDAIGLAKKVPDRSYGGRPPGGDDMPKNPSALVDPKLFAMLFGSVIGANRIAGIKFEGDVLKELGFDKNTTLYEINVPGKGTIRVIPDGDDENTILEVKNVNRLSGTRQLLAEIRVAQESGKSPVVVTDERTKLSGTLRDLARSGAVKIYRRTGPGEYTNVETGDQMTADPQNRGIVPKDPSNSKDPGTVGESGDSGGPDGPTEMPDEPGGPPPEAPPEMPEMPEGPEELPDIIEDIIP